MRPVPGANGEPVNWINYRTGIKGIFFRMDADNRSARIAIELGHSDDGLRDRYYIQLRQLRAILEKETGEEWVWEGWIQNENGQVVSRISHTLEGVNIFNEADWPVIISFFKQRIMMLDRFWNQVKEGFE